ncbi:MAG: hypothetical protein JWQ95_7013 [Sphaerisporangium sp.]|nr:hypothetical protein [Sphaerisporangium sp.]
MLPLVFSQADLPPLEVELGHADTHGDDQTDQGNEVHTNTVPTADRRAQGVSAHDLVEAGPAALGLPSDPDGKA